MKLLSKILLILSLSFVGCSSPSVRHTIYQQKIEQKQDKLTDDAKDFIVKANQMLNSKGKVDLKRIKNLLEKYYGLYLVIGEIKNIDIKTGITKPTNKFNIIGGKRNYDEDIIQSTIRECKEEFGLTNESNVYKFINNMIPKTRDIIKCQSFNVFCIYYTPNKKLTDFIESTNFVNSVNFLSV
jgi:hypothetical protein